MIPVRGCKSVARMHVRSVGPRPCGRQGTAGPEKLQAVPNFGRIPVPECCDLLQRGVRWGTPYRLVRGDHAEGAQCVTSESFPSAGTAGARLRPVVASPVVTLNSDSCNFSSPRRAAVVLLLAFKGQAGTSDSSASATLRRALDRTAGFMLPSPRRGRFPAAAAVRRDTLT